MVVRRKKDGGLMLSCLGYPGCRAVQFFPPCVTSAQPHTSLCGNVWITRISGFSERMKCKDITHLELCYNDSTA